MVWSWAYDYDIYQKIRQPVTLPIGYPSETHLMLRSHKISFVQNVQWSNRFVNIHRARHWYCPALCKFSKQYHKLAVCYVQMTFRDLRLRFVGTNILYYTACRILSGHFETVTSCYNAVRFCILHPGWIGRTPTWTWKQRKCIINVFIKYQHDSVTCSYTLDQNGAYIAFLSKMLFRYVLRNKRIDYHLHLHTLKIITTILTNSVLYVTYSAALTCVKYGVPLLCMIIYDFGYVLQEFHKHFVSFPGAWIYRAACQFCVTCHG